MKLILTAFLVIICFAVSPAQEYTMKGMEVSINKPVLFEPGSAVLLPESNAAINIIKKYLDDKAYITLLRIEGHATGGNAQPLSEERALAICKKLIDKGIDCKRLLAVGFGDTKPIEDNNTPEGKSANTRITFINAALRSHAIGGMPVDGGGVVAGNACE